MLKFYKIQDILRDPEDTDGNTGDPDLDILNEVADDIQSDDNTGDDIVTDDDNPLEEDENTEEPKETPEGEDENQLTRVDYLKLKDALKDNPTILKAIKTQFFREQKFTELFPNVEDAQNALNAQGNYEQMRDVVMDGKSDVFLSNLKEASPEALGKFAANFLPNLSKVDNDAFVKATSPIIQNTFYEIAKYGEELGGDKGKSISEAAKLAHFVVFGNDKLGKPSFEAPKEDEKLQKDRAEFLNTKYQELQTVINQDVDKQVDSEIEKGLDPTGSLKPGLKKLLIKEIKNTLYESLNADKAHMGRMTSLWQREQRNGFKGELKDSIKATFLSRAKTLIPKIRAEKRKEIFATQKSDDKNLTDKINSRHKVIPTAGKPQFKGKIPTKQEARKAGMTDMDILNS